MRGRIEEDGMTGGETRLRKEHRPKADMQMDAEATPRPRAKG